MQNFLSRIHTPDIHSKIAQGTATRIEFDKKTKKHKVYYTSLDGQEVALTSDFVLVCTGNDQPLPLEGGHISIKIPEQTKVNRWSKGLSDEEILDMDRLKQRVLFIGWGNSTLDIIREIEEKNKSLGTNVEVVVVTHFSDYALRHPYELVTQPDGKIRSVARRLDGEYLTGVEIDLPASRDLYEKYINSYTTGDSKQIRLGTIAGVTSCEVFVENNRTSARITSRDGFGEEREYIIPNIGEVDALIGYRNNPELMESFGLDIINSYKGTVRIRSFDGRAITRDNRNVYVVGAAATGKNPSAGVIPGIISQAAEVALSLAFDAVQKYEAGKRRNSKK